MCSIQVYLKRENSLLITHDNFDPFFFFLSLSHKLSSQTEPWQSTSLTLRFWNVVFSHGYEDHGATNCAYVLLIHLPPSNTKDILLVIIAAQSGACLCAKAQISGTHSPEGYSSSSLEPITKMASPSEIFILTDFVSSGSVVFFFPLLRMTYAKVSEMKMSSDLMGVSQN